MLAELAISNFILIKECRLVLGPGFNVFTGETGAGKSLVVDALKWLLGGRLSQEAILQGHDSASVEAVFELDPSSVAFRRVAALFAEHGFPVLDADPMILRRSVNRQGKGRSYVNDRPVTAALLALLADDLIDMTHQHEGQGLLRPTLQRELLDASKPDIEKARATTAAAWRRHDDAQRELSAHRNRYDALKREEDYIRYQLKQLQGVSLAPDAEETLLNRRHTLKAQGAWRELADEADQLFGNTEGSPVKQLGRWLRRFEALAQSPHQLADTVALFSQAMANLEEGYRSFTTAVSAIAHASDDLEQIESQLSTIKHLKRKYRLELSELIEQKSRWEGDMAWLDHAPETLGTLEKQVAALQQAVVAEAATLTALRKSAAQTLAHSVTQALKRLGMPHGVFLIEVVPYSIDEWERWSEHGADAVGFLFSANKGQEPKALNKIASGGELSRTLLAVKTATGNHENGPAFLFDEIDSGIGGQTADLVGQAIAQISRSTQVLCVTHLAQVAQYADTHFAIEKSEADHHTVSTIHKLTASEKPKELARMLGGDALSQKTHAVAQDIAKRGKLVLA